MDVAGDGEESMGGSLGVIWCGFGWHEVCVSECVRAVL